MQKIVEYRLVNGDDIVEFSERVNHWIAKGFQPLGSVSCSHSLSADGDYNERLYAQAMVRHEDAENH